MIVGPTFICRIEKGFLGIDLISTFKNIKIKLSLT